VPKRKAGGKGVPRRHRFRKKRCRWYEEGLQEIDQTSLRAITTGAAVNLVRQSRRDVHLDRRTPHQRLTVVQRASSVHCLEWTGSETAEQVLRRLVVERGLEGDFTFDKRGHLIGDVIVLTPIQLSREVKHRCLICIY